MDHTISKKLEHVVSDNSKLELTISDQLLETPTTVERYIEMITFIKSKELESDIQKITDNSLLSTRIVEVIT
jgi:hypothetical protein